MKREPIPSISAVSVSAVALGSSAGSTDPSRCPASTISETRSTQLS